MHTYAYTHRNVDEFMVGTEDGNILTGSRQAISEGGHADLTTKMAGHSAAITSLHANPSEDANSSLSHLVICVDAFVSPRVSSCLLVSLRVSSCLLVSPRVSSCLLVSPRVSSCLEDFECRCVCVCVYVYIWYASFGQLKCMYVCVCVCIYICIYIYILCMYVCMHVCMYMYIYTCIYVIHILTYIHVCI